MKVAQRLGLSRLRSGMNPLFSVILARSVENPANRAQRDFATASNGRQHRP
jgi:hypothetical protein